MTLTTHAIVGAAAASLFPNQPLLAFAAGFASHFAIDALPHWDYRILSKVQKEDRLTDEFATTGPLFLLDLLRIGSDALLGLVLAVWIFSFWLFDLPVWFVALGACAGILPDPLQFVYYKFHITLLRPLQRFHIWIQKGRSIYPHMAAGIFYQLIMVVAILFVLKLI
ncbi:MAG: hypothetical protein V4436_00180 [Patescibacteria group bacterium]